MKCYGVYYKHLEDCAGCELRDYCKDAKNPPLLASHPPKTDEYQEMANTEQDRAESDVFKQFDAAEKPEEVYTRADLLEAISFVVALDYSTLEYLSEKLRDPEISFSKLARNRKISRQAVHKFIRQRCERIPEIASILQNRIRKHKPKKSTEVNG